MMMVSNVDIDQDKIQTVVIEAMATAEGLMVSGVRELITQTLKKMTIAPQCVPTLLAGQTTVPDSRSLPSPEEEDASKQEIQGGPVSPCSVEPKMRSPIINL